MDSSTKIYTYFMNYFQDPPMKQAVTTSASSKDTLTDDIPGAFPKLSATKSSPKLAEECVTRRSTSGPSLKQTTDGADPVGLQSLEKDDDYFMDEVVTFQVEHKVFRVSPSKLISASPTFASMFDLLDPDGTTTKKTIMLPTEVRAADFKLLLKILYPSAIHQLPTFSMDEWISILRLSTLWRFVELRKLAMAGVARQPDWQRIDPIDCLRLGREFSIITWVADAYNDLVARKATLTDEEVAQIGFQIAIAIYRMREETPSQSKTEVLPWPDAIRAELTEIYNLEINFS